MNKEVIYSYETAYRGNFSVNARLFGRGERVCCIVGGLKSDDYQQLYICSVLIKKLKEIEAAGGLATGKEIMIIPSLAQHSVNAAELVRSRGGKDISDAFPGTPQGEQPERIAYALMKNIGDCRFGIELAPLKSGGEFIPHVRLLKNGFEDKENALLFGMDGVILREARDDEKNSLVYNWQSKQTSVFSLYAKTADTVSEEAANSVATAVLRFLSAIGAIEYKPPEAGVVKKSRLLSESELLNVYAQAGGIFKRLKNPGDGVKKGEPLAEIISPYEGEVVEEICSPVNASVLYAHSAPLIISRAVTFNLINNERINKE